MHFDMCCNTKVIEKGCLPFPGREDLCGWQGRERIGSDHWSMSKSSQDRLGRWIVWTVSGYLEAWENVAPSGPAKWLLLTRTCVVCS